MIVPAGTVTGTVWVSVTVPPGRVTVPPGRVTVPPGTVWVSVTVPAGWVIVTGWHGPVTVWPGRVTVEICEHGTGLPLPSVQEPGTVTGTVIVSIGPTGVQLLIVMVGPVQGIGRPSLSKHPEIVVVETEGGGHTDGPFVMVTVLVCPPPHGTGVPLSSKQPETVIVAVVGGGTVGHWDGPCVMVMVEPPPHGVGLPLLSKQPVTVTVDGGGTAGQLVPGSFGLTGVQLPVSVMVDGPPLGPQSVMVLVMISPGTVSVTAGGQVPVQAAQVVLSARGKSATGLALASKLRQVSVLGRQGESMHTSKSNLQAGRGGSCLNAY